jgi:hypothetical protein
MRSVRAPVRPNDDQTNEKGTATMKLTTTTFALLAPLAEAGAC